MVLWRYLHGGTRCHRQQCDGGNLESFGLEVRPTRHQRMAGRQGRANFKDGEK